MARDDDRPLAGLEVVVLDCQTTGAVPGREHLLELAWWRGFAGQEPEHVESLLVGLPEGETLPKRIRTLTGISEEDLQEAVPRDEVHLQLLEALHGARVCVAHFSRFEERFLHHLHDECSDPGQPFPLSFLCTHEISRRVLPEVPRKGLKALSGYLGYSLPELKRAAAHVEATVRIWNHLVPALARDGVRNLQQLQSLLSLPPPEAPAAWDFPLAREKRLALLDQPGVYRFLGPSGEVLYVGRATSLKSRVNSYYRRRRGGGKGLEIAAQARDIECTETPSRLEAGLLEAQEIRRLAPPYNDAMRDRGRRAWHFSRDLLSAREEADAQHIIGPVLGRNGLLAVSALCRLLEHDSPGEEDVAEILGMDAARMEPGALAEALGRFRVEEKIARWGASPPVLLALGVRLQRQRLLEKAEEDESDEELEDESAPAGERPLADADQVERWLGGILRHGIRQALRGRWYRLLEGSTIAWSRAGKEGEPGHRVAVGVDSLDAHACVYLSVFTAEIRRLLTEGRTVSLDLPSGKTLCGPTLTRILDWV